jgi:hypothetical protein
MSIGYRTLVRAGWPVVANVSPGVPRLGYAGRTGGGWGQEVA